MTARTVAALAIAWLGAGTALAADDPKAFACTFNTGVTHAYEKGAYTPEKAAPLAFGIGRIDLAAQSADLRTERGTGSLKIARAINATHYLEVANEGFLNITTIYDRDDGASTYPAVHSRHLGILGQPLVTQYQGFCEPRD
jgi:hypothetical protein